MTEQDLGGLLALVRCPACRAELRQAGETLLCQGCGRSYPVRDGVPILLLDEATLPEGAAGDGSGTEG